MRKNL